MKQNNKEKPDWRKMTISEDGTYHIFNNKPLYPKKFTEVLKFHHPGLAPVKDGKRSYHINISGEPAYSQRFIRVFGFYQERAAVSLEFGWCHILPTGNFLYTQYYAWVGNFQYDFCVVRDNKGNYFHITLDGTPLYEKRYLYAGDFKDNSAVIRDHDGFCYHINKQGDLVHGQKYLFLGTFHKGYACALDKLGWFHVNSSGEPIYQDRFNYVEPFYNGFALCETKNKKTVIINEDGKIIHHIC